MIIIDLTPPAGTGTLSPVPVGSGGSNRVLQSISPSSWLPSSLSTGDDKIVAGGQGISFRPPGTTP